MGACCSRKVGKADSRAPGSSKRAEATAPPPEQIFSNDTLLSHQRREYERMNQRHQIRDGLHSTSVQIDDTDASWTMTPFPTPASANLPTEFTDESGKVIITDTFMARQRNEFQRISQHLQQQQQSEVGTDYKWSMASTPINPPYFSGVPGGGEGATTSSSSRYANVSSEIIGEPGLVIVSDDFLLQQRKEYERIARERQTT